MRQSHRVYGCQLNLIYARSSVRYDAWSLSDTQGINCYVLGADSHMRKYFAAALQKHENRSEKFSKITRPFRVEAGTFKSCLMCD